MTPQSPSLPSGPCTAWCTGLDVWEANGEPDNVTPEELDAYALTASELLFQLSGRLYAGDCETTVRPCRTGCGCWGDQWGILASSWFWGYGSLGYGFGWGWRNAGGDSCGCGCTGRVKLAGFPVTEVTEVVIGEDVIDPAEYQLQGQRYLMRFSERDPDSGVVTPRWWPSCQNLKLELGEPGTWSVSYRFGSLPPTLGVQAATEMAWQLYLAQHNPGDCALPTGVTEVVRQGITIKRVIPMLSAGPRTGLVLTDSFLAAYNPNGLTRRPAVWTPDLSYPRRIT